MQKYIFRKYNPEYKKFFNLEKKKLIKALGATVKIEHIGSTAIPDLGGKGIIDIAIGVVKSKIEQVKNMLEDTGYEFREQASTTERFFFRKDYPFRSIKRRAHIHLTQFKGQDRNEMIGFRDYLLQHPETIKEYSKVKKEAVQVAFGDGAKYRKYKEKFIQKVLRNCI